VLEASIHWGHFPTEDIARKSWMFRSTGLGLANLASLLMEMGCL
jgi:ribonucleoside-diphosphate reductase alpha chain